MSDLSLPVIQDFVEQFQDPSSSGSSSVGNNTIWQGIVTGIDNSGYYLTVNIAGKDVPNLRCLQWPFAQLGEVVWGIQEGRIKIVLGVLAPSQVSAAGLLAEAIVSSDTSGICKGRYANGTGSGVTNVPVTSSDVDLNLGVINVPVKRRRLMEVRFRITGVDHVAGAYNTISLYTAYNGGSYAVLRRSTEYQASFSNKPRYDSFRFVTKDTTNTISLKLYGNTDTGTAYFYRYSSFTAQDHSWFELHDLGSAADFIAQGGVY